MPRTQPKKLVLGGREGVWHQQRRWRPLGPHAICTVAAALLGTRSPAPLPCIGPAPRAALPNRMRRKWRCAHSQGPPLPLPLASRCCVDQLGQLQEGVSQSREDEACGGGCQLTSSYAQLTCSWPCAWGSRAGTVWSHKLNDCL